MKTAIFCIITLLAAGCAHSPGNRDDAFMKAFKKCNHEVHEKGTKLDEPGSNAMFERCMRDKGFNVVSFPVTVE